MGDRRTERGLSERARAPAPSVAAASETRRATDPSLGHPARVHLDRQTVVPEEEEQEEVERHEQLERLAGGVERGQDDKQLRAEAEE